MSSITPSQCRAARALLNMNQTMLAAAARVGLSTVKQFEIGHTVPLRHNMRAMQEALEAAGVEFIPENGGGAGVRMRHREG